MEPSINLFDAVLNPTAAFTPILQWEEDDFSRHPTSWETSQLNIKNRVDSLELPQTCEWRLDGVDFDSRRFFAVPHFALGKPPLRIDVYIHNQDEQSPWFRHGSTLLCPSTGANLLDISKHLLRALALWSAEYRDFEAQYQALPFGSRIVIDNIEADARKMEVYLIPVYDIEQQWYSLKSLQAMWQLEASSWPETLDFAELGLQHQYHEAVSIVEIPGRHGSERFVFKSLLRGVKYFYHELKMLLTLNTHPSIVPRPIYVVEKACRFGGKRGICGFVIKFYHNGNLRDALSHTGQGDLSPSTVQLRDQFRWARDVTRSLIHISKSPMGFYPDIKPDNVVLEQRDGVLHAVLIDLEQRGGWYSWSPPEVAFVEYLEYIATRMKSEETGVRLTTLLRSLLGTWNYLTQGGRYRDCEHGFSSAWLSLSRSEWEAAQVFMLGKLLWCIFESSSSVNCALGPEMFRAHGEHGGCGGGGSADPICFPEFRQTPAAIRRLIRDCTAGAAEWKGRFRSVLWRGGKLYSSSSVNDGGEIASTRSAREAQLAAKQWWEVEVREAMSFVEGKIRSLKGSGDDHGDDNEENAYVEAMCAISRRPGLERVMQVLDQAEATALV